MKTRNRIFLAAGSIMLAAIMWLGYIQLLENHGVLQALITLIGVIGLIAFACFFIILVAVTLLLIVFNLTGT
ncbi:hypothetical protein GH146_01730 [archaeon]|jgi:hypothetical protein|nr:hypothetical protein [archaeon]